MKVETLFNDVEKSYLYCERYVNNGSPSKINNTTSLKTRPTSKYKTFSLYLYDVNKIDGAKFFEIGEGDSFNVNKNVLILHPDSVHYPEIYRMIDKNNLFKIKVVPNANGRTVKICNKDYFYKLSYQKFLGRIPRILTEDIIRHNVEVCNFILKALDAGKMNKKMAVLKENYGQVVKLPKNDNEFFDWGTIIREFKPYPYVEEDECLIPFFSLFGIDILNPNDKPIIIQLFEKQYKILEDFLLEDILFPLYETYFDCLLNCGIELEAHAQNMLFTVDKNFRIKRIVCRDFESAGKDVLLMDYLKIKYDFKSLYKTNNRKEIDIDYKYPKYTIMHSFMFDFKLGEYITTPILNCVHSFYSNLNLNYIQKKLKEFNKRFIDKLPDDFFPPEWFYYENIIWGEKKRIYKYKKFPKYRY